MSVVGGVVLDTFLMGQVNELGDTDAKSGEWGGEGTTIEQTIIFSEEVILTTTIVMGVSFLA
ncbi:MAG: hypothetical protein C0621_10440 [Desulfuromonas sp.]|nr:MAG: hypothetical protein C0621_10440 [Desulfuromonas sp.]